MLSKVIFNGQMVFVLKGLIDILTNKYNNAWYMQSI